MRRAAGVFLLGVAIILGGCSGNRPPAEAPLRLLSCSDFMCMAEARDGSLVFLAKVNLHDHVFVEDAHLPTAR